MGDLFAFYSFLIFLSPPLFPAPPPALADGRRKNRKIVNIRLFKWMVKIRICFSRAHCLGFFMSLNLASQPPCCQGFQGGRMVRPGEQVLCRGQCATAGFSICRENPVCQGPGSGTAGSHTAGLVEMRALEQESCSASFCGWNFGKSYHL